VLLAVGSRLVVGGVVARPLGGLSELLAIGCNELVTPIAKSRQPTTGLLLRRPAGTGTASFAA
jgi:hypothetical protein